MKDEAKALQDLLDRGYTVEVRMPSSKDFSVKYNVYKKGKPGNGGNKGVIINSEGKIVGLQG